MGPETQTSQGRSLLSVALAFKIVEPKYIGVGSQLAWLYGRLRDTVIAVPPTSVAQLDGVIVIVPTGIPVFARTALTRVCTADAFSVFGMTATRAPSLAAIVIICVTMPRRAVSSCANTKVQKIGIMNASSMAAAPDLRRFRVRETLMMEFLRDRLRPAWPICDPREL